MRWIYLYLFLILSTIFQSLFLNFEWSPMILWPALFYFFLYQNWLSTLFLLFFASLLSSVFLSLSVPHLFFIYLFGFISLKVISFFFSYKSLPFFLLWVCVFSFIFCVFIQGSGFLSSGYVWAELFFNLIKSISTGLIAVLFFIFLKPIFPISEGE